MVYAMDDFGERLTAAMAARGLGVRALARRVHCDPALISRLAAGKQNPSPKIAALLDEELVAGGTLTGSPRSTPRAAAGPEPGLDDELAAIEISRRASSTSVGEATVGRLEQAVNDLAVSYSHLTPGVLLRRVRGYLDYATGLIDGKVTLGEHQRLLVTTGWLSLLSATCLIDLRRFPAAAAYLRTAAELARETGQAEIAAWALETKAWQLVTDGAYERAVALSQAAQRTAPQEGSAVIQATAQEARAWARLGAGRETRAALARAKRSRRRSRNPTGRSITTDTTRGRPRRTSRLRSPGLATRQRPGTRGMSSGALRILVPGRAAPGGSSSPGWTSRSR